MKLSNVLVKIMLALFFLITTAAMLTALVTGFSIHSYLITLLLGFATAAAFYFLSRKLSLSEHSFLYQRLGKTKVGAILTGLCFVVSSAWILAIRIEPFSDYMNFWQCACDIAAGRAIADADFIALFPHIIGYSSFLSLFIRLFGENAMLAPWLNVVLTCASGLLLYVLCLKFTSFEGATVAYTMWIFFPSKLMLNSLSLSEPLYTCLILLFIFLLASLEGKDELLAKKPLSCVLWGLALGVVLLAVNIVRPLSTILLIAFFIWLFLLRGERLKCAAAWKTWLLAALVMLGVYCAGGQAWKCYQESVLGEEPAGFPIYNLYVGFNGETQGQWSAEDMELLISYKSAEGATADGAQKSMLPHLQQRLSTGNIDFAALFASKLFTFLGNDELGGYTYRFTRSESFVKICMLICNTFYYGTALLSLAGLTAMLRKKLNSPVLLAPLYSIGLTLAHMLFEVTNRYHYSAVPMLLICASFAIPKMKAAEQ